MKKILTIILTALSVNSFAQIEASVGGGINTSIVTKTGYSGSFTPFGSLSIGYIYKGFAFGVRGKYVDYEIYQNNAFSSINIITGQTKSVPVYASLTKGTHITIYANKIFKTGASKYRIGVSGGLIFGESRYINKGVPDGFENPYDLYDHFKHPTQSNGISFGVDFGYSLLITKNLSINADFNPQFCMIKKTAIQQDVNIITLPLSLGIGFNF